ncbi:hypothetical protein B0H13DRAFT_1901810 [Mycena leptocephala]|nr:hypothetical protein B0H13DRAFT_1901810 [Mycena leptocephala]
MLNARLLVHNPETGEPGAVNGHAGVQFYAAPNNGRVWNMEVPYVSDAQISAELPKYGLGVHREIQKDPDSSSDESAASEGWRVTPPIVAPIPRHVISMPTLAYAGEELEESIKEIPDAPPSNSLLFSESLTGEADRQRADEEALFPLDEKVFDEENLPTHDAESSRPSWALQREILGDDEAERDLEAGTALALKGRPKDGYRLRMQRWKLSQGQVERIPYNARTCNWQRSEVDQLPSKMSAIDQQDTDESSSSGEEEGEIVSAAPPPAPRRVRTPSVAPSESTVDQSAYNQPWNVGDSAADTGRLAEAERLIDDAVHSAVLGTANPARRPRAEEFFDLPAESSDPDAIFHFEPDSDSLPDLVEASSSDSQEALLERLRDDENRHALLPLHQALEIINQRLGPLIDRSAMADCNGTRACNESMVLNAERTLDLVAGRVVAGKRKVRDDSIVDVSGDGKRMRRLGGSAWARAPASRVALRAEVTRLRAYLSAIIDVRGNLLDFTGRAVAIATRRRYALDMTAMDSAHTIPCPFLKWEELAQLRILRKAFNDRGQSGCAEDCRSPGEGAEEFSVAKAFERACFDHRYSVPVSNAPTFLVLFFARFPFPLGLRARVLDGILGLRQRWREGFSGKDSPDVRLRFKFTINTGITFLALLYALRFRSSSSHVGLIDQLSRSKGRRNGGD